MVRILGRRGSGPGEFRRLESMGVLGDTVYVADSELGQVTYFGLTGDVLKTVRWATQSAPARLGMYAPPVPGVLLADGSAIATLNLVTFGSPTSDELVVKGEYRTPVVRLSRNAEVLDTVVWSEQRYTSVGVRTEEGVFRFACPFDGGVQIALRPDGAGVVSVDHGPGRNRANDEIRVVAIDPRGDTTLVRSLGTISHTCVNQSVPIRNLRFGVAVVPV